MKFLAFISALVAPWTWKMAWRDTRSSRRRLAVFSLSVVFGVGALVAIGCFRKSLEYSVDEQARGILGADLVIASREAFSAEHDELFLSLGGEQSREVNFSSMIFFPLSGGTRLAQIRALSGNFPFYGRMEATPESAASDFRTSGSGVLVEDTLLVQFNAQAGSEIRIGDLGSRVLGSLHKVPGETVVFATIAPRVYMAMADLEKTRLLRQGSLARYKVYFRFAPGLKVEALVAKIRPELDRLRLSNETVEKRKRSLGRSVDNLYNFLNLVGFVALLLGGVGIANAIHVQVSHKLETVAVLRCLGVSSTQTLAIYLLQGVAVGLFGAAVGAIFGVAIERFIPVVLGDFLPVKVPAMISWSAIGVGLGAGLLISTLFTLIPLASVRKVSPLRAIRQTYAGASSKWRDPWVWTAYAALASAVVAFSLHSTKKPMQGWAFAAGLAVTAGVLLVLAKGMMFAGRRLSRAALPYAWRQGLANLHRPNNRTALLMLSLGLGTFLILTVYIVQHSLLSQLAAEGYGKDGDTVLFDVQPDQRADVLAIIRDHRLQVLDEAPLVTMRLSSIKGRAVESILRDRGSSIPHWALRREYRSTYSDRLRSGEKVVAGKWPLPYTRGAEVAPISVEQGIANDLGVVPGDELIFNVQGVPVKTRVASLREVDWRRVQPNFFVVFPPRSLEGAPSFFALVTRTGSPEKSAALQRAIVQKFSNISIVDLRLILNTIDTLLNKISIVLQFMALFTAFTGVLVLVGAVLTGRYQRMRESVLLRTLGASRRQIFSILTVEYFSLGLGAVLTGCILAWTTSWGLAHYVFHTGFTPGFLATLIALVVAPTLTIVVGLLMSRDVVGQPPIAVLRSDAM